MNRFCRKSIFWATKTRHIKWVPPTPSPHTHTSENLVICIIFKGIIKTKKKKWIFEWELTPVSFSQINSFFTWEKNEGKKFSGRILIICRRNSKILLIYRKIKIDLFLHCFFRKCKKVLIYRKNLNLPEN